MDSKGRVNTAIAVFSFVLFHPDLPKEKIEELEGCINSGKQF